MNFTGQVAIITGAASGMGAATAREFAAAGGHVVIVDRNADLAQQVAKEIGAGEPVIGDVSDSAFCNQTIETALTRHGRLDVLVNAAGVIVRASGEQTTDEQWQRIIGVNLNGVFFMCRAAIPAMKRQGKGAIVNFGSIWGDVGAAGVAAYCATKGGVHLLTKAMALDHATDGIRINAVCPGTIDTPMVQDMLKGQADAMKVILKDQSIGRLGRDDEVAAAVLWLCSPGASFVVGVGLPVDGGFTIQ